MNPSFLGEMFSLEGRVALVTGGNSGIGAAMARALARAGASVVLLARTGTSLRQTVAELRAERCVAEAVVADLADRAALGRATVAAAQPFGDPDILVNSAGVNLRPPMNDLSTDDWDHLLAVNLTAPFLLGQAFGPMMAGRGFGRIINVVSTQANRAFGNSGGYGASKGGLASLTRSQSEAWARYGVCCNAVSPGFVPTAMTRDVAADPVRSAALAARTMTGRNGTPADFSGITVFLASPASSYITGQVIAVDGGLSAT